MTFTVCQCLPKSKSSHARNDFDASIFRLSKKDALIFKEEDEDALNETLAADSAKRDHSPSKGFERKNSFLGKLFSSKRKPGGGSGAGAKPEMGTFSAQVRTKEREFQGREFPISTMFGNFHGMSAHI